MTSFNTNPPDHQFEDVHWTQKFGPHTSLVKLTKYDAEIRALINVKSFNYVDNIEQILDVVRNKNICAQQSALLKKFFKSPDKYLQLDVDAFVLLWDCNENKLVDAILTDNALEHFSVNALGRIITLKRESDVGKVNSGYSETSDTIYYTHRFSLSLFNNRYKKLQLYIADGTKGNGERWVKIDIKPTHFSQFELQVIFSHLRATVNKCLGDGKFNTLMNDALVERIDIGFNLPGVSQLFLFVDHFRNKTVRAGECWPTDDDVVTQTTYIGRRVQNNHHIVYDKLLKELKLHALKQGWFAKRSQEELAKHTITARVERRHWFRYPRYNDKTTGKRLYRPLAELCSLQKVLAFDGETDTNADVKNKKVSINFSGIHFFNPEILPLIAKKNLRQALFDKSVGWSDGKPASLWKVFRTAKVKQRKYSIKLDEHWYEEEKQKLISRLVETVRLSEIDVIKRHQYQDCLSWWRSTNTNLLFNYDTPVPRTVSPEKGYPNWRNAKHSRHPLTIVYGGAGTGKTKLLLERAKWLIGKQKENAREVYSIAFTNPAVNELEDRYSKSKVFRKDGLPVLATFTSWCGRMLKLDKAKFGEYTYLDMEEYENKRAKYIASELGFDSELSKRIDHVLSFANKDVKRPEWAISVLGYEKQKDDILKGIQAYQRHKGGNKWDFDDVLVQLENHLKDGAFAKKVASHVSHLQLDEMQDSNRVQLRIIEKLLRVGVKVFMVGDTSQSIYAFRGSKPELIERLLTKHEPMSFRLNRQHRASLSILRLTNFVRGFTGGNNIELSSINTYQGTRPKVWIVNDLEQCITALISYINDIPSNDIKVLARMNNQVKALQKYLKSDLDADNVITMHKAKGIECNTCIVVDPRFSNSKRENRLEYHRLIYTALTRPSENLLIIKKDTTAHFYRDGEEEDTNILDVISSLKGLCNVKYTLD